MSSVVYTYENNKTFADFARRKKTRWLRRQVKLFDLELSINLAIENGKYEGSETTLGGKQIEGTIVPLDGYKLPETISVEGCSYTYDAETGKVTFFDFKDNVTLEATCPEDVVPSFADDTWANIAMRIKSGLDPYQVGDTKVDKVTIGGVEYNVTFRIVDDTEGRYTTQSGTSHKVIMTDEVFPVDAGVAWNASVTAYNNASIKTYLNETALAWLSSDLQAVLETTTVYSGPGNANASDANRVAATGKIFIPAYNELYDAVSYGYATDSEGTQFSYYADLGVTSAVNYDKLIRKDTSGTARTYWTRSPYSSNSVVNVINYGGSRNSYDPNNTIRVPLCFAF